METFLLWLVIAGFSGFVVFLFVIEPRMKH